MPTVQSTNAWTAVDIGLPTTTTTTGTGIYYTGTATNPWPQPEFKVSIVPYCYGCGANHKPGQCLAPFCSRCKTEHFMTCVQYQSMIHGVPLPKTKKKEGGPMIQKVYICILLQEVGRDEKTEEPVLAIVKQPRAVLSKSARDAEKLILKDYRREVIAGIATGSAEQAETALDGLVVLVQCMNP